MTTATRRKHPRISAWWDDEIAAVAPAADDLVDAVHALDADAVAAALERARRCSPHPDALAALAVLLAAAVPEDALIAHHVMWTTDPARYARMRAAGVEPALVCAAMADIFRGPGGPT